MSILPRTAILWKLVEHADSFRYACNAGSKFVGCCTQDPCTNGCFQGNLRAGGLNITTYGKVPDASCGSASQFYTCTAGTSFWGCCKSDPCAPNPVCPPVNLVPAFMERPEQFAAYAPAASPQKKSSHGAAIGGGVGGGVGALLIGVLIFLYCRRKKRNSQANLESATPMMKEKHSERLSVQHTAQSRTSCCKYFHGKLLTNSQHPPRIRHHFQMCIKIPRQRCILINKIGHQPTKNMVTVQKTLKNYQQTSLRQRDIDTLSFRERLHPSQVQTGLQNYRPVPLKSQPSSSHRAILRGCHRESFQQT
jgi:hypothetical protein